MSASKTLFLLFTLYAALMLSSGCSFYKEVYSEQEPGVNIYQYKTYGWLNSSRAPNGNSGPEPLTVPAENAIRHAVEDQLNRNGFRSAAVRPDLLLHYHVVVDDEVIYTYDPACEKNSGNALPHCHLTLPVYLTKSALILDFIDPNSGNQVWRGVATGMLDNIRSGESDRHIRKAVRQLFTRFPRRPVSGIANN